MSVEYTASIYPLTDAQATIVNVAHEMQLSTENRTRELGALVHTMHVDTLHQPTKEQASVADTEHQPEYYSQEELISAIILRSRIGALIVRGCFDDHFSDSKELYHIKETVATDTSAFIVSSLEELVIMLKQAEHKQPAGDITAITEAMVKLIETARHLDVEESTWLAIVKRLNKIDGLEKAHLAKLPPPGLASKYFVAA